MKTRILRTVNYLISLLIGSLLMNGCKSEEPNNTCEYGTPYATFDVSGTVSDQQDSKPLDNIRITVEYGGGYPLLLPDTTDKDGLYKMHATGVTPTNRVDIIAEDLSGVYQSDTVRDIEVKYFRNSSQNDSWNKGEAIIKQDFQLKK